MASRVIIGSLAGQNWHRQARRQPPNKRFDFVVDKTIDIAKRFGFDPMGIDISVAAMPSTDSAYLDELAARLKENKLLPAVGVGPLLLSNDVEVRRDSVDAAKRNLEIVARLGAERSFFGAGFNGRVRHEGRIRYCIEMARELGLEAQRLGIRITQENFDYFNADDLVRITQGVGLENVGVHSDTGNWLITGEDPLTATKKVLPYTLHAHVRDYLYENDTYNGVAVGDGLVDFPSILPELAKAGEKYPIIFSMEVDTDDRDEDECAERSYAYLKKWATENGYL